MPNLFCSSCRITRGRPSRRLVELGEEATKWPEEGSGFDAAVKARSLRVIAFYPESSMDSCELHFSSAGGAAEVSPARKGWEK